MITLSKKDKDLLKANIQEMEKTVKYDLEYIRDCIDQILLDERKDYYYSEIDYCFSEVNQNVAKIENSKRLLSL